MKVYWIPEFAVERFNKTINKLAARADRLGLPEFGVHLINTKVAQIDKHLVKLLGYTISGSLPVESDEWVLAATAHPTPSENIFRIFDVEDDAAVLEYKQIGNVCQHCNVKRQRNDYFILRNKLHNTHIQVGSGCMKQFLDTDAEKMLKALEFAKEVEALQQYWSGPIEATEKDYSLYYCLPITEYVKNSGFYAIRTAADAIHPKLRYEKEFTQIINKDIAKIAEMFLSWLVSSDASTVKGHNYKVLGELGFYSRKDYYLIQEAYAEFATKSQEIAAYLEEVYQQCGLKVSQYIGKVGEKLTLTAKCKKVLCFPNSRFGGYFQYFILETAEGNQLVWKTSSGKAFKEGISYTFTATIKDHSVYDKVAQTILERPSKIVEVV